MMLSSSRLPQPHPTNVVPTNTPEPHQLSRLFKRRRLHSEGASTPASITYSSRTGSHTQFAAWANFTRQNAPEFRPNDTPSSNQTVDSDAREDEEMSNVDSASSGSRMLLQPPMQTSILPTIADRRETDNIIVLPPLVLLRPSLKRQRSSDSQHSFSGDETTTTSTGVGGDCLSPAVLTVTSSNVAAPSGMSESPSPLQSLEGASSLQASDSPSPLQSLSGEVPLQTSDTPSPLSSSVTGSLPQASEHTSSSVATTVSTSIATKSSCNEVLTDDNGNDPPPRLIGHYRVVDPDRDAADQALLMRQRTSSYAATTTNASAGQQRQRAVFLVADTRTGERKLCQPLTERHYVHLLRVAQRLGEAETRARRYGDADADWAAVRRSVLPMHGQVVAGDGGRRYLVTAPHYGSLHSYVQGQQTLSEAETRRLYVQAVRMTALCHSAGIIMRDLKLRKFVFSDPQRTQIRLDTIDDLTVCADAADDSLTERQGCPAYVSPEILDSTRKSYSGKAADIWSLGVLLFVMLLGRYPFYASTPAGLFSKIRQGSFCIPESARVSTAARTLLAAGLLRRQPSDRPSARTLLALPWLQSRAGAVSPLAARTPSGQQRTGDQDGDQVVPDVPLEE